MHFVGLTLQPLKESAHAIPAPAPLVLLILAVLLLPLDDEILVRSRQLLEGKMDIDVLPRTGSEQILLRFAHLFAAKNPHRALRDRERSIRERALEIDPDRAPKTATLGTGAERAVKTKKPWRRRTNIEIAMRAMPAGRVRPFGFLRSVFGVRRSAFGVSFAHRHHVDPILPKPQRRLERLNQPRTRLRGNRDSILDHLHPRAQPAHLLIRIRAHHFAIEPDAQIALLLQKLEELPRISF